MGGERVIHLSPPQGWVQVSSGFVLGFNSYPTMTGKTLSVSGFEKLLG